jgi:hypothetical protein
VQSARAVTSAAALADHRTQPKLAVAVMKTFLAAVFVSISVFPFASSAFALDLYGVNAGIGGGTYLVDQATGAVTHVGEIGVAIDDLASDTRSGHEAMWGVGVYYKRSLFQINPLAPTVISSVQFQTAEDITTLAIDPTSGMMFGTSDADDPSLFQIDRASGNTTLVGSIGISLTSLAFDQTGRLFGTARSTLVEIDPSSADISVITDALPVARLEDMASRPSDNTMFALGYGPDYNLYTVDVTNGTLQEIGPSVSRPAGLAFFAVPEPGSLALLLLGLLALRRKGA